jgi:hypothetical protein
MENVKDIIKRAKEIEKEKGPDSEEVQELIRLGRDVFNTHKRWQIGLLIFMAVIFFWVASMAGN